MTGRLPAALLLAALAWSPQQLIVSDERGVVQEKICSTSAETCRAAVAAIAAGLWAPELRARRLRCEPAAGCFSHRAQCIANFNCPLGGH